MGKVVEFPYDKIENPIDHAMDHVQPIVYDAVASLSDLGYDVLNEKFQADMSVVTNLLYAACKRQLDEHHLLHDVLDELDNELKMIRKILDDID